MASEQTERAKQGNEKVGALMERGDFNQRQVIMELADTVRSLTAAVQLLEGDAYAEVEGP